MLFTDSPPVPPSKRLQTRVSYEQNGFTQFAAVTNKEISQIIKQAVPKIHEEGDQNSVWNFKQVRLCLFDLNLSMKTEKRNVFVCKCKLSPALLYLADMFTNKLKTTLNVFYRIVLNIKRIHNSF